jgi:hypothetical protein
VLLKRWIVEWTFGWANRVRRLAKDFEMLITSAQAWFMLAMRFLLIRRIARDYKKGCVIPSQTLSFNRGRILDGPFLSFGRHKGIKLTGGNECLSHVARSPRLPLVVPS